MNARIECIGGASGNMLLGALIDAGLDAQRLERELHSLPLPDWRFAISRVQRHGIAAVHVDVQYPPEHAARHLPEIARIIWEGDFSEAVKRRSTDVFVRLADAEAKVHGIHRDEVHFHEVGAVDAIVDIVGTVLGLATLDIDAIDVGELPIGTGPIHCAHGVMPNPAPATAELLQGVPVRFTDIPGELVTPTAAALLVTLGQFGKAASGAIVDRLGYGAGTRDPQQIANLTRIMLTRSASGGMGAGAGDGAGPTEADTVIQIDTNIDDMNPQLYDLLVTRLFERGALDVYLTPITMKKGRPATLLSVLCREADSSRLADLILAETTTLGVRMHALQRRVVEREIVTVDTPLGVVRVKRAGRRTQPEYDDCRAIAEATGMPLLEVIDTVRRALDG